MNDRPTTGVFIVWDEEDVEVQRRDAGGLRDRTIVTGRFTVARYTLWSNDITDATIAAAERYVESIKDQYDNVRVHTYDGSRNRTRRL